MIYLHLPKLESFNLFLEATFSISCLIYYFLLGISDTRRQRGRVGQGSGEEASKAVRGAGEKVQGIFVNTKRTVKVVVVIALDNVKPKDMLLP